MKVYAVYSIPKSPEYKLEKLFISKEFAKKYIKQQKEGVTEEVGNGIYKISILPRKDIFDIQIEEIEE